MDPIMTTLIQSFQSYWWCWLLTPVIAYLLGSVNPAVIVTKIATKGKKDIREMGSGNAGFTNVLRSVGKTPAIITIVSDALKCVIAVLPGPKSEAEPDPGELLFSESVRVRRYWA